jgi:hypothetical protein
MFDKLSVACLEVVWRFERRTFQIFSFIEGPTHFGMPIGARNEFGSLSINRNRLLFVQFQTLLPTSMDCKWEEMIDFVCKTTQWEMIKGTTNSERRKVPLGSRIPSPTDIVHSCKITFYALPFRW